MSQFKSFFYKVIYAVGANLVNLIVSALATLVIPKFLGAQISDYGYFQVYIFYTSYIGFFHFGWCDGIYLRDGGKEYESLDKTMYSSQFWLLLMLQVLLATGICCGAGTIIKDPDNVFISRAISACMIIYLPRTMLAYYLQTTNRIKEYAALTSVGRIVYGVSIVLTISLLPKDYRYFIYGDVFGKLIGLVMAIWWCRDIVSTRPAHFRATVKEAWINISVGIKLMFANIASMLLIGLVRWAIQVNWDVETYGKISLTLNVSNLLLAFISAVALVLYPTLRRSDEEKLKPLYDTVRNMLMLPMLGCLVLYYPVQQLLSAWLPQYADSLRYMAILFPLCIYAAKMTLLIQTYMNVFRFEKEMLKVNLTGLAVAAITTLISVFWLKNLTLAMLSMVINQIFRCNYAELVLARHIGLNIVKDAVCEFALVATFIISSWFIGGWIGVGIYLLAYMVYLFLKRDSIELLTSNIKYYIDITNREKT